MPATPFPVDMEGSTRDPDSIAVIGLACRFPGDASSPERFWEMLCEGRSAYSEANRYDVNAFHGSIEGRLNTSKARGAHFLHEDVAAFDANFFTINENEAIAMDPQGRIMLEIAYEAFESAGLPLDKIAGTNTSCLIGNFTTDYRDMLLRDPDAVPRYTLSGSGQEMISNRLSWFYDLRGTSFTLGTACSSSLVALHQGCQSLRSGDAEMSIVGGCNLLLNPDMFFLLSNLQFLAQDGRCKSFDAKGDGYGRGEGFAAVVLKRVDDAIRDGDPIRAVIRGTGANQDGHTKGITVPNSEAQARLIRSTYSRAGLNFHDTHYVETHGTGTKAGDPLELKAISNTLGSCRDPGQNITIGSVKPNIGHLEATSGLAGLIKAIHILERGIIPPNILFSDPNPQIPFEEWKIAVPTKAIPWPTKGLRRISVQGFGYGGTNAHAILDDAFNYLSHRGIRTTSSTQSAALSKINGGTTSSEPRCEKSSNSTQNVVHIESEKASMSLKLFVLSTQDRNGIKRQRESLRTYLQSQRIEDSQTKNRLLRDLAFTLSEKRSRLMWNTYVAASSLEELLFALHTKESEVPTFRFSTTPRIGFIFTGQGAQWARMGIELNRYPVFRTSVEKSDIYLRSALSCPWSAAEEMRNADGQSQMNNPAFSQPLCTILQIALVDLLESWNVVPSAIVGHSSGEIAGAYCLGALTKADALKAAYFRGLLSARMKDFAPSIQGAMLAVGASESQARNWIDDLEPNSGEVVVACVNSPSSVTLSGDGTAIDKLQHVLQQQHVFTRKLKVETAYHSPHMNVISMPYMESLSSIEPKATDKNRRMYSAVTGGEVETSELGPVNWVRNLVSPVLFYDALYELLRPNQADGRSTANAVEILVELGPHSTLQGAVNQIMTKHDIRDITYLSMLSRGRNAVETAVAAAAALYAQGIPVHVNQVNKSADDTKLEAPKLLVNLPPYIWNHSRTYWAESRVSKEYRLRKFPRLSLLGAPCPKLAGSEYIWRGQIRVAEQPWIQDHKIQTSILYPAAGYLAMAIEAAAQVATKDAKIKEFKLRDIQIVTPAVMNEESDLECVLQVRPHRTSINRNSTFTWMEFAISSCHRGEDLRENCFGLLQIEYQPAENSNMSYENKWEDHEAKAFYLESKRICNIAEDPKAFYTELAAVGLNYGSTFQNLKHINRALNRSCFTLDFLNPEPPSLGKAYRPHIIHPTNLDAMFHGFFAAFKGLKGHSKVMVPTSIKEIAISADIPFESGSRAQGACKVSEHGFRELMGDLVIFDEQVNDPIVTVKGFQCSEIPGTGTNDHQGFGQATKNIYSEIRWKPAANLLTSNQVCALISPTTHHTSPDGTMERLEDCESLVFDVIQRTLDQVSIDQVPNIQLRELYIWMQEQQMPLQNHANTLQMENEYVDDSNGIMEIHPQDELPIGGVEGEATRRIRSSITRILCGLENTEELLLCSGLLRTWLSDSSGIGECFTKLGEYIDLLAHQEPTLSILEIGGDTGEAAPFMMSSNNGNPRKSLSFLNYIFSSPTDAKSKEAEHRLSRLKDRLVFKTLSTERDPRAQGFGDGGFDVIICSSLGPSCDQDRSLANVRQLLRPGGKLCLVGMMNPGLQFSLVVRCLQALPSNKHQIPIDSNALNGILKRNGFTTEFIIEDFEMKQRQHLGVIVAASSTAIPNGVQDQRPEVIILEAAESTQRASATAVQLASELESRSFKSRRLKWGTEIDDINDKTCISLLELGTAFLEEIGEKDFANVKRVIASLSKVIWVTSRKSPAGALSIGMGRSIRNEMTGKHFSTVSVQEKTLETPEKLAQMLIQLIITSSKDHEFLEDDGVLKICRVVTDVALYDEVSAFGAEGKDRIESVPLEEALGPLKLALQSQGLLDSMCLETDHLAATMLERDEVEIEVKATGLNFRDVMVALGQIPDNLLGFDASGIVTRVGKEVSQFRAGDRVCTLGHGTHRTHFRNKADFCQTIPDDLSFEEAATLPLVHCTAYHALVNVARICPKQTILIHAAAGGVGQAAIQLAKHFDLEIFATVGSDKKKQMMQEHYEIPSDHIFNSRDLSFTKGVLRMTNGRGVDCVLNSLSGQALQETWRCIAPFGHFVEIGIRDILDNTGLEMRPFMQDATFTFLNLKHIMTSKPKLLKEILEGTFDLLRRGFSQPVWPMTTYPISAVEDAFRLMQTGKHLGKIAIRWTSPEVVPVLRRGQTALILNPNATYVLVGGFGGLGRSLAGLLVHLGALNLCFISRSGKTSPSALRLIEELSLQGIRTASYTCDIASKDSLAATIDSCSRTLPPIAGVIQCAMVLRDVAFETMTHAQWTDSLRPKVQGTWNLHSLLPANIDFFITLSSFAGIFGNRTQSNYAAGCAFQDALAHHRTSQGLKAVTIDLGIMRDVGVIAQHGATGYLKEWELPFGIREGELHLLISTVIHAELGENNSASGHPSLPSTTQAAGATPRKRSMPAQILTGFITATAAAEANIRPPFYFDDARFSHLAAFPSDASSSNKLTTHSAPVNASGTKIDLKALPHLITTDVAAGTALLTTALVHWVAKSLQADPTDIITAKPLHSYGMDSLVAIELASWLFRQVGVTVTVFEILAGVSIEDFAAGLVGRVKGKGDGK